MRTLFTIFVSLVSWIATQAALQAEGAVALKIQPTSDAKTLAEVTYSEVIQLRPMRLLTDDGNTDEWYWVEHTSDFIGFVRSTDVKKDLSIKPDALVFLEPSGSSPILGSNTAASPASSTEVGPDWTKVIYTGKSPAYFKKPNDLVIPEFKPLAPVATVDEAVSTPVAEVDPVLEEIPMAETISILDQPVALEEPRPSYQPQNEPPAVNYESDFITIDAVESTPVQAQNVTPITSGTLRTFEGTLKKTRGFSFFIFGRLNYDYVLIGTDGKKLAFVETKGVFTTSTLKEMLNQPVVIQGVAESLEKTTPSLLIKAQHIRKR